MIIFLIAYLLIGTILTLLLIQPEEGETIRQLITDAVISIVGWPIILYMCIKDMFKEDDE